MLDSHDYSMTGTRNGSRFKYEIDSESLYCPYIGDNRAIFRKSLTRI